MPDLPTITVTTAQANKLLEVFGDANGYRAWLKEAVKEEARNRIARSLHDDANAQVRAGLASFETELPE